MTSSVTDDLHDVWGSAASNVVAVGNDGTILRYNGSTWSPEVSDTSEHLYGVSGSAPDNIIAVGANGTIVRYNGSNWSEVTHGATGNDLFDVLVVPESVGLISPADVWAVGANGTIMKWLGDVWQDDLVSPTSSTLTAIAHRPGNLALGISPSTYVVGKAPVGPFGCDNGVVFKRGSSSWNEIGSFPGACATAAVMHGSTLYVGTGTGTVGTVCPGSGTVHKYQSGVWSDIGPDAASRDLWAGNSRVASAGCRVKIFEGGAWMPQSGTGVFNGVWGAEDCTIFAVGVSGSISWHH